MARLEFEITGNIAGLSRAVTQATSLLNRLNQAGSQSGISAGAQAATNSINGELGAIQGLQRSLSDLNRQRVSIHSESDLPAINREIQAVEQEISRLNNIGRSGFDSLGNAIQSATRSNTGFASGLRGSFGLLRQIAYILPGIGIAGIFNLGFQAIGSLVSQLDIFTTKLTIAQQVQQSFNDLQKQANDLAGSGVASLKVLYDAATNTTLSMKERISAAKELKDLDFETFGNATNLAIVNGKLKLSYDELTVSILAQAKAQAATNIIGKLYTDILNAQYQQQKIQNANANEIARAKTLVAAGPVLNRNSDALINNPLQDLIDRSNNSAKESLKEQQDIIDARQAQIKSLEGIAASTTKTSTSLSQANKLLGVGLSNYSSILATASKQGDLKQLQSLQSALQTVLSSLAPKDPQINTLRSKIQQVEDIIKNAYSVKPTKAGNQNIAESLSQQLDDILRKTQALSAQSGLSGYQLQIQKINDEYRATIASIDKIAGKAPGNSLIQGKANIDRTAAGSLRDQQTSDATIGESNRVAGEIQRINDGFGVKSQTGRDKELASIQKMYDTEIQKAGKNKDILIALDADRITAIQAVADKYASIQADLYDKINTINDTANAAISGKEESQTQKIINEWEARRKAANGYYEELIKLNAGNNITSNAPSVAQGMQGITAARLDVAKAGTNAAITKGSSTEQANANISDLGKLFNKTFDQSIKQLGSSFSNTLTTIGQDGNRTIGDIFSNLQKDLSKTLLSTVVKFGTDYLGDALKKGITGGTGNLSDIFKNGISSGVGAGLALAGVGSLVSGLTSKTSYVGQGIGGALTGAGTGAVLGTTVFPGLGTLGGALIGGGIGLIGGLFGAKGARKKEQQLQEQQLAEAQKQTALLRQQALAYTASITGKMTTAGIITGVDINSFGQLIATVSGKDLQFVLDRNSNGR